MSQATGTLPNAFIGKPEMPTDDDLAAELRVRRPLTEAAHTLVDAGGRARP
jgi:hypothetical protein